jgi:hypothetical protein
MTDSRQFVTGWVSFNIELSKQFLRRTGSRLFHAAPILLLVMGPLIIGLIAFIALAPMMAPGFKPHQLVSLVLGQGIVMVLPLFLARKLVLPTSMILWSASLPIKWQTKCRASASAALVLLFPIFVACTLSAAVWFWQWPRWLRPVWGSSLLCLVVSMLGAWFFATAILTIRAQSLLKFTYTAKSFNWPGRVTVTTHSGAKWRIRQDLILKPVWRNNSLLWRVLHPLLILCAGVCIGVVTLADPKNVPWRESVALLLSTLIVGLTLWRDAHVQTILARLKAETAALPLLLADLIGFARFWAVGPAIAMATLFLFTYLSQLALSAIGAGYFAVSLVGPYAMLALSKAATPGRASFAVCLWALLVVIGYFL